MGIIKNGDKPGCESACFEAQGVHLVPSLLGIIPCDNAETAVTLHASNPHHSLHAQCKVHSCLAGLAVLACKHGRFTAAHGVARVHNRPQNTRVGR